jgi:hypothetical protein
VEAQIAALRAELLRKEQENARVQAALAKETEQRERAQRQVWRRACSGTPMMRVHRHPTPPVLGSPAWRPAPGGLAMSAFK